MEKKKLKNLIEMIEKKSKNSDQLERYIKLIIEGILTSEKWKKEIIIAGLYNLEFEL